MLDKDLLPVRPGIPSVSHVTNQTGEVMNQRKTIDEFIEELKNVRTVSTNEQKDKVIEELYRIGKRLDVTDIKRSSHAAADQMERRAAR